MGLSLSVLCTTFCLSIAGKQCSCVLASPIKHNVQIPLRLVCVACARPAQGRCARSSRTLSRTTPNWSKRLLILKSTKHSPSFGVGVLAIGTSRLWSLWRVYSMIRGNGPHRSTRPLEVWLPFLIPISPPRRSLPISVPSSSALLQPRALYVLVYSQGGIPRASRLLAALFRMVPIYSTKTLEVLPFPHMLHRPPNNLLCAVWVFV